MAKEDAKNINNSDFYKNAEKYWAEIDPTLNGVLGGFGFISNIDLCASNAFLSSIFQLDKPPGKTRALDCGAGIGRISKGLLVQYFEKVDLVEQNAAFLEEAMKSLKDTKRLGELYNCGLQNFQPSQKYDLIWCQWVLGHLTDDDLRDFLTRCVTALLPQGIIVIKENVSGDNEIIHDSSDSSFTRPAKQYLRIFKQVPLKVIKLVKQNNFPDGLFPVKIFALQPFVPANGELPTEKPATLEPILPSESALGPSPNIPFQTDNTKTPAPEINDIKI